MMRPNTLIPPYRWELVAWLWLAYLMNQADRQIFNVVLPQVKIDMQLTDVQAGLIGTVFTATMALMLPFAGIFGDRFSRSRIVVISLLGWSLATMMTGFAPGLLSFIAVRSVATAVGEAIYVPSACALIAEHHVGSRSQALALHQSALYFGAVLGGLAAGYIADLYGWKYSFWVFGAVGIVLALTMARRLKDVPREKVASRAGPNEPVRAVLGVLLRTRTALVLSLVLGGATFVNMGYLAWMPTYMHERFGLSLAQAGFSSVFYHQVFAFVGVMLGGRFSDKLAQWRRGFRLELSGVAILFGAPALYLMGTAGELWVVYAALGLFGLCRGLYDSNIYASLYDVVAPRYHASATGMMVAFSFAVGALAPIALGAIKQYSSLGLGLAGLGCVYILGGVVLIAAARWVFPADARRLDSESRAGLSTANLH